MFNFLFFKVICSTIFPSASIAGGSYLSYMCVYKKFIIPYLHGSEYKENETQRINALQHFEEISSKRDKSVDIVSLKALENKKTKLSDFLKEELLKKSSVEETIKSTKGKIDAVEAEIKELKKAWDDSEEELKVESKIQNLLEQQLLIFGFQILKKNSISNVAKTRKELHNTLIQTITQKKELAYEEVKTKNMEIIKQEALIDEKTEKYEDAKDKIGQIKTQKDSAFGKFMEAYKSYESQKESYESTFRENREKQRDIHFLSGDKVSVKEKIKIIQKIQSLFLKAIENAKNICETEIKKINPPTTCNNRSPQKSEVSRLVMPYQKLISLKPKLHKELKPLMQEKKDTKIQLKTYRQQRNDLTHQINLFQTQLTTLLASKNTAKDNIDEEMKKYRQAILEFEYATHSQQKERIKLDAIYQELSDAKEKNILLEEWLASLTISSIHIEEEANTTNQNLQITESLKENVEEELRVLKTKISALKTTNDNLTKKIADKNEGVKKMKEQLKTSKEELSQIEKTISTIKEEIELKEFDISHLSQKTKAQLIKT